MILHHGRKTRSLLYVPSSSSFFRDLVSPTRIPTSFVTLSVRLIAFHLSPTPYCERFEESFFRFVNDPRSHMLRNAPYENCLKKMFFFFYYSVNFLWHKYLFFLDEIRLSYYTYIHITQSMIIFIIPMKCVNEDYAVDMFVPRERSIDNR